MSWYNIFQTQETVVTSTTTNCLMSTNDPLLIYSTNLPHAAQATVGTVSTLIPATLATSGTAGVTNITPYGYTTIQATGVAPFTWTLNDPPSAGICKTFYNTTTTCTANIIKPNSATIQATDVSSGSGVSFTGVGSSYVELVSKSTSTWVVTGRSAAGVVCT